MAVPLAGRATDERSRVKCLVPARGARRDMVLDEVSAAIPRDAVARNVRISRARSASAGFASYSCYIDHGSLWSSHTAEVCRHFLIPLDSFSVFNKPEMQKHEIS